ncbi:MAG: NUDIX hydrolase [Actinomycetota bacterium]
MISDFERQLSHALSTRTPRRSEVRDARAAAVLIPVLDGAEPALLLTLRTDTVSTHKGQISFPGGSLEPGENPELAALREAHEEIALDPSQVRVLGRLDQTPTFVSGYVITPVVGWVAPQPVLEPNPSEVAALIRAPIAGLTEEIRVEPGFVHEGFNYPTEAWIYEGHIIWGVTARLLRMFLGLLADAGLATAPGETLSPWPVSP